MLKAGLRLSIRWKLFLIFTLLFSVMFAISFFWFYNYSTELALSNLRDDLRRVATSAASRIDESDHTALATSGKEGDPIYTQMSANLRAVRDASPVEKVATIYTMVKGSDTMVKDPDPDSLYYVVTANENPVTGTHLLDAAKVLTYPQMLQAFFGPTFDPDVTVNARGDWFSGYAPIPDEDSDGSEGIVGVRVNAKTVSDIQEEVRRTSFIAFVVVYGVLFVAVSLISFGLTRPLKRITSAAQALERGEAYDPGWLAPVERNTDELGDLARVFNRMAQQVKARETQLRQEVAQLRIEIDEAKQARQVAEIVDTDYFQDLRRKAGEMRAQTMRRSSEEPAGGEPASKEPAGEDRASDKPVSAETAG